MMVCPFAGFHADDCENQATSSSVSAVFGSEPSPESACLTSAAAPVSKATAPVSGAARLGVAGHKVSADSKGAVHSRGF